MKKEIRIDLSASSGAPLPRQIRDTIRRSVLTGQLHPGARLPSSRALATELGVSRNSVVDAYDQLLNEGYVEGRRGSGTFVGMNLSIDRARQSPIPSSARAALSARGRAWAALTTSHSADSLRPFSPGIPVLNPSALVSWFQMAGRVRRRVTPELLNYGDAAGYRPLREAIAGYLGPTRGVTCGADQVVITGGTQQALSVAAHLLLDPGEPAWVEDPGYPGAAAALGSAGAHLQHVTVDGQGLDVAAGMRRAPGARLAYVSPSHQYPLGVTMTLPRRLELLRWADSGKAWILEDDYDSEFRYVGRTLPALQGLDHRGRVVYFGTFSKTLFPSLRIGYVIVPIALAQAFAKGVAIAGHGPSLIDQAVLHQFIESGCYSRHLKQVRGLYHERHAAFCEAVRQHLGDDLQLSGEAMGLHVAGELLSAHDDVQLSRRAATLNLSLPPLSKYYGGPQRKRGFVMGYGHLSTAQIQAGVRSLAAILRMRKPIGGASVAPHLGSRRNKV